MAELAAVVLAHADAEQVRRLVRALDGVPVVLHCDARTPGHVFAPMVERLPARVALARRVRTAVTSWSLVDAELVALERALTWTGAHHIAVLSGADYPIVPVDRIVGDLRAWQGRSFLRNVPLPFAPWNTPRHPDGGLWRLNRRFITLRHQVISYRGIPLRWPVTREIPSDLELRASSQWKVYCREDVERLLDVAARRPDLMRFWRTTLVPDETFAASVLASRRLFGSDALAPCQAHAWFMTWPGGVAQHPDWLDERHFPAMAGIAAAEPLVPQEAADRAAHDPTYRRWFARKLSTAASGPLADRIDRELLAP